MAKNILILTDFSGGTWDAVCFAMKLLRNRKTTINLLQTYQKPEVGQSMIRDIVPILKKISIDDLEELRRKILNQFKIPKRRVKPLSIEGNLNSLLSNQLNLDLASRNLVVIEKTSYQRFKRSITKKLKLSLDYAIGHPVLLILTQ